MLESLEREGVVSLIDFAYGFSSEVNFVGGKRVESHIAGPWWRWARLVVEKESRAHSESLVALVRRAALWRPVATDGPLPHVHVSTRPFRSEASATGLWPAQGVPDPPGPKLVACKLCIGYCCLCFLVKNEALGFLLCEIYLRPPIITY